MEQRMLDVDNFLVEHRLDERSNVQFGEGGAGTFSDGKLMTRINDSFCRTVLEEFVTHGAPKEILTAAKPHIGTDILRKVVVVIREEIIRQGGEVRFHTLVEDVNLKNGRVVSVTANGEELPCDCLLMAPGNAARGLFSRCLEHGIPIEAKPFRWAPASSTCKTILISPFTAIMPGIPGSVTANTSFRSGMPKPATPFIPSVCARAASLCLRPRNGKRW